MLLLWYLPREGWLQATLYTNYVIKALIRALENFTGFVTYQKMSRNWCRTAARQLFGCIDFKTKENEQEFKALKQNQKKSFTVEVGIDVIIRMLCKWLTAVDSNGLFWPSKIWDVVSNHWHPKSCLGKAMFLFYQLIKSKHCNCTVNRMRVKQFRFPLFSKCLIYKFLYSI